MTDSIPCPKPPRRRWRVVAVALAIVGMLLYLASRSGEPRYHGKSVAQWLEVLAKGQSTERRGGQDQEKEGAIAALQSMGPKAVPFIVRHLDEDPPQSALRRAWVGVKELSAKLGYDVDRELMFESDLPQRVQERKAGAALALLALGKRQGKGSRFLFDWAATNAIGDLWSAREALRDELVMDEALKEEVVARLRDPALGARRLAVLTAAFSGPELEMAFPTLTNLVNDPDPEVRHWAISAISWTGRNQPGVIVPILVGLLTNAPASNQRQAAAVELGNFGTNALAALPALEQAATGTDPYAARAAKATLLRLRQESP